MATQSYFNTYTTDCEAVLQIKVFLLPFTKLNQRLTLDFSIKKLELPKTAMLINHNTA